MTPTRDTDSDSRIERLERRVDKIEDLINVQLQRIFEAINALTVEGVKNACPSPGACVNLTKELAHSIKAHDATMMRVERIELKMIDIDREMVDKFHKIETQKAWVLGAWSVIAFCAAIVGALATILISHYLPKP